MTQPTEARSQTLNELRDAVGAWCERKGWRDDVRSERPNSPGDLLMLAVTELSEALEEVRDHRGLNEVCYATDKQGDQKPEGVPIELADAIIRIADMADRWGIDLDAAVTEKMAYNERRSYRHDGRSI